MPARTITHTREYELFCQGRLANPYPLYHELLSDAPVHWCEPWGCWVVTRYDDVRQAHANLHLSSDKPRAKMSVLPELLRSKVDALGQHLSKWVSHSDPPDHTRLLGLVNQAFTPRSIQAMRSRISTIANELIDTVEPRGRMDLIGDFAYPMPVTVVCELLGIPAEDRAQFGVWIEDIVAFLDGPASQLAEVAEQSLSGLTDLTEYFDQIISRKRAEPGDDLISTLLGIEEAGDRLTDEELLAMCVQMLVAGNDTTTGLIGNGIFALLQNGEEMERLSAHPEMIKSAVEEFLRYESPGPRNTRIATEDMEIGGLRVREGQTVALMVGAANRDPMQFPDPDRLDIGRSPNKHLAFGWGVHFCLGAPLARLEGQIAVSSILRRLPGLRLADEQIADHPPWRHSSGLRLLDSLPVEFGV